MSAPLDGSVKEKRAEVVARQIEADVFDLGWPVGQVIAPEVELLDRYGVSRAVFREAVRLLEHNRLAKMRRGPGGGLVVHAPPASVAAEAIATYLGFADVSVDKLIEARQSVERATVTLAAERISEEGIARLRDLVGEDAQDRAEDHPLHICIAELSGNAALVIFVAALSRASGRWAGPHRGPGDIDVETTAAIRHAHRAIAEAIIAGDGARAARRMNAHLAAGAEWLRRRQMADGTCADVSSITPAGGPSSLRLAARVADAIKRDLRDPGTQPGDVVASEADLIDRHRVSRASLREAIRILEHNGVAKMRRGPGGGLVVGQADPTRVLDVVCNYLLYAGLDRDVLYDARRAVELTAIELATEHLDDDGAARLEDALAREHELGDDVVDSIGDLHVVLADLSGNRALSFFVRVLTRLTARLVPPLPDYPASIRPAVEHAHRRIADAVIAGDASLARRRMLHHLEALAPWISAARGTADS